MKKIFTIIFAALLILPYSAAAQKTTVTRVNRNKTYRTVATVKQPKERKTRDPFFIKYSGDVNIGFTTGKGDYDYTDHYYDTPKHDHYWVPDFSRPFVSTTHGVQIYKYAFAGVGMGLQYMYGKVESDYYNSEHWKNILIPIYVNLKGMYPIKNTSITPFVTLSLGYSAAIPTNSKLFYTEDAVTYRLKGGFHCECGAGLQIKRYKFSLGLQHQDIYRAIEKKYESGYLDRATDNYFATSFYFNIGINF